MWRNEYIAVFDGETNSSLPVGHLTDFTWLSFELEISG